jgi:hypothetical protein
MSIDREKQLAHVMNQEAEGKENMPGIEIPWLN